MTIRLTRFSANQKWMNKLFFEDGSSGGGSSVTAKSVVFDIADNWGNAFAIGVRSIEFKSNESIISLPGTGYTAYATTQESADYVPSNAFNTTLSKTSTRIDREWLSRNSPPTTTNQRLIIVFDTEQMFDEIIVNNSHNSGTTVNVGSRNVKITYSTDSITDTTYNAAVSNGIELNNTEWAQHVAANVADDQTVWSI